MSRASLCRDQQVVPRPAMVSRAQRARSIGAPFIRAALLLIERWLRVACPEAARMGCVQRNSSMRRIGCLENRHRSCENNKHEVSTGHEKLEVLSSQGEGLELIQSCTLSLCGEGRTWPVDRLTLIMQPGGQSLRSVTKKMLWRRKWWSSQPPQPLESYRLYDH